MHQNSPTVIADLKNFPGGRNPRTPVSKGAASGGRGRGRTGWEVGRGLGRGEGREGREGRKGREGGEGRDGLEPPFVKS